MKTKIIIMLMLSSFCWGVTLAQPSINEQKQEPKKQEEKKAQIQTSTKIIIGKTPPQKIVETSFSISKLTPVPDSKAKKMDTIVKKVNTLVYETDTITKKVDTLIKEVGTLTKKVATLTKNMDALTKTKDTLTKTVDILVTNVNILPKETNATTKKMDTLIKEVSTLTKKVATLAQNVDTLVKIASTLVKNVDALTKTEDTVTKTVDTLVKKMDTIAKETNAITKKMDTLVKLVNTLAKKETPSYTYSTSRIYKGVKVHKIEPNKTHVLTYSLDVAQKYLLSEGYCIVKTDSIYSDINIKRIVNSEDSVDVNNEVMKYDGIAYYKFVRKDEPLGNVNDITLSSIRMLPGIQKKRELRWNRTFETFSLPKRPYLRASIHSGPLASYRFVQVYNNNITDGQLVQNRNEADYSRLGWATDVGLGIHVSPVSSVSVEGIWGNHGYNTRNAAVDNKTGHLLKGPSQGKRFEYFGLGLSYNYDGIGRIVNFSGTLGIYSTWLTQYNSGAGNLCKNNEMRAANLRLQNWMLKGGMGINFCWDYRFAFQVMPVTYFDLQSADYATDLRSFLYDFGLQVGFVTRFPTFKSK